MAFKLRNFTIEAFNRDVNQSGDLLHKYNAWSAYRAEVTAVIGEAFAQNPDIDRALVTAAGNLNDIDLPFLCARLTSLTLSDADAMAMKKGIDRQRLSAVERSKIKRISADYSGAGKVDFFGKLEALAGEGTPAEQMADFIKTTLASLASAPATAFPASWPLVICCPVYTQLLYTQIEVFLKLLYEAGLYSYDDLNRILNAAYGAMPGILARYNAMLQNACEPGGLMVLLTDRIEAETGSEAYQSIKSAAKDGLVSAEDAQALTTAYGAELSQLGYDGLLSCTQTIAARHIVWPFSEAKVYLVSAVLLRNKHSNECS